MLTKITVNNIAILGVSAFETISGEVVNVGLFIFSNHSPADTSIIMGIDTSEASTIAQKIKWLESKPLMLINQRNQLKNPDGRVVFENIESGDLLNTFSEAAGGLQTFDKPRFIFYFCELPSVTEGVWSCLQSTINATVLYGGRESVVLWENGAGQICKYMEDLARDGYKSGVWRAGVQVWGKKGVLFKLMGKRLEATLYTGQPFENTTGVLIPKDEKTLPALWCYCSDNSFSKAIRKIDKKLAVTNGNLAKVPFDIDYWQKVAAEKYPDGLPKPYSDDPTQWLFNGHPKSSTQSLHVAVARLLGYRWPRQTGSSFPDCPALDLDGLEPFADEDGIVCLPPLNREQPAATRLRQLLQAALGIIDERALVASSGLKGSKSKTLEEWLRDEFFEQHTKLFNDRPFIWHLWDGRPDGFHALVNYHKLDHATLQKLTYSFLGNWIQQQSDDVKADKPGAAERLGAARALQAKLSAILEGEAPLDVFVRWKPLKDQAQGWHPDLNDGIRQNIRPFLLVGDVGKKGAGLFRAIPLVIKDKDRGTEPTRPKSDYPWFWCKEEPGTDPIGGKDFVGTRWNNVHLTLETKRKASE